MVHINVYMPFMYYDYTCNTRAGFLKNLESSIVILSMENAMVANVPLGKKQKSNLIFSRLYKKHLQLSYMYVQ